MNEKQILVVSGTGLDNQELIDWMNQNEKFELTYVQSDEQAIELFHQLSFDLVVVNSTVNKMDYRKLNAVLPILDPEVELLAYQGESASELSKRIKTLFEKKKLERLKNFLVLDSSQDANWAGLPKFSAN